MWQIVADWTNRVVIIFILVMGASVAIARMLTPLIADAHSDIEAALSAAAGRQVSVKQMKARWRGFGPKLILEDISLGSDKPRNAPIRLSEIRIGFDLWDSITSGKPVPDMVALVKAHLRMRQMDDGQFRLMGINDFDLNGGNKDGADLSQIPIVIGLIDSEITLETPKSKEPLRLYNLNLKLRQLEDRYKIGATLQIGGHTANKIELNADLFGDPTKTDGWHSNFHLTGKALALESLMKHFLPGDFKQVSGMAEFQLWGKLHKGELKQLEGDLAVRGITIERVLAAKRSTFNINQLISKFRWLRKDRSWRLELVDLQLKRNETLWPKSALTIHTGLDNHKRPHLEISSSFLRLQDLLSAVTLLPPAKQGAVQALQKLQPAGDLRNLSFVFKDDRADPTWHLTGIAERFRIKAWKEFPGINGLSLSFTANQQGGAAIFNSKEVVLSFAEFARNRNNSKKHQVAKLFRNSIRLKTVSGPLIWNNRADGWEIESTSIVVDTPDFKTHTRFALNLPQNESPVLDLQTNLSQGDVTYIRNYLPAGVMNNKIISWLDRALVSGQIHSGTLLIRGPMSDFPFDKHPTGRLEALLEVEDAILNYNLGWPRLERMSGELRFLNNSFSARIFDAEIYASRVIKAEANIERLNPATPLILDCEIQGPLADYLRILTDTPLAKQFSRRATVLESRNDAKLAFRLNQPLNESDSQPTEIEGRIGFQNNDLRMTSGEVDLTNIHGNLHFDREKVWAKGIRAKSLGSPIVLDISSPKKGPKRTEIDAKGKFRVKTLMDRYVGVPLKHVKGETDWHLNIDIPHSSRGELPTTLTLLSGLKGVSINMPSPFGKKENDHRELSIKLDTVQPHQVMPIRIKMGKLADSYLQLSKEKHDARTLERAEIRLGGARAKRPKTRGLHIIGSLPHFQLDPWLEMFHDDKQKDDPPIRLQQVNVDFGRFQHGGLAFDNILIKGNPTRSGWSGMVDSPQIKGKIDLPKDLSKGAVKLALEHYSINTDQVDKGESTPFNKFDPRKLPALDIYSKSLVLNEKKMGTFSLKTRKVKKGIQIKTAEIKSGWFQFNANGSWTMNRKIPETSMKVDIKTNNLGELIKALGFAGNIKKGKGKLSGQLRWPGDPTDIKNLWLTGNLDLSLKNGSFVDIDPGAGRIFGLLNLGALHKRLILDFSDIFGKGLKFDKIEGSFTLDNGDAYTHDLEIESSTGDINVSGRTGLVSQDFDQLVTVIPDVTGTIATVGAIATGPVIGAALYLTNKVVGKKINKGITINYQLEGPWDNPKIISSKQKNKSAQETQQHTQGFDLDL